MSQPFKILITISALLLAGATPGWAGLGDIDANFGTRGRIEGWGVALLVLPDDRLVIVDGASVGRFDPNGKADQTFGDGGRSI